MTDNLKLVSVSDGIENEESSEVESAWVAPEVLAAEKGEKVEFGKTISEE